MLAERAKGREVGYWYLVGGGLTELQVALFTPRKQLLHDLAPAK